MDQGQVVNILGFVGHMALSTLLTSDSVSVKMSMNNM